LERSLKILLSLQSQQSSPT